MSSHGKVACGWTHSILISDGGKFYGWGIGEAGQLGAEKGYVKFAASTLNLGDSVAEDEKATVAVGSHHSVILSRGKVFTMGSSLNGRLGHNKTHGKVDFPANEKWITHVSAGTDFTIAVGLGQKNLYAWGLGKYGNLGDGDTVDRDQPVLFHLYDPMVPTAMKQVAQISCGSRHTLAVTTDGDVYSWGFGKNGRLGHGSVENSAVPKRIEAFVLSDEQRVVAVAAGDSHSMARSKEGRLYTWGSGSYGRLGLGAETDQYVPKIVEALKDTDVLHIACNTFHSVAVVDPAGGQYSSLFAWGGGKYGKLGLGPSGRKNLTVPTEVPFFKRRNRKVVLAECGLHHTVAVTANGRVFSFGYAAKYRCGVEHGSKTFFDTPQHIKFFDREDVVNRMQFERESKTKDFKRPPKGTLVAVGRAHSMCLADEKVLCWGENVSGQMGTGYHQNSFKPIQVGIKTNNPIVAIACGGRHSMAVDLWGSVFVWGSNEFGQLGLGHTKSAHYPTLIEALQGTKITHVYAGNAHSAVVEGHWQDHALVRAAKENEAISHAYVWGSNQYGQLGIGGDKKVKKQTYPAPVALPREYNKITLALGSTHSLILCTSFKPKSERKENPRSATSLHSPNIAAMDKIESTHLYVCGANQTGQLGLRDASTGDTIFTPKRITHAKDKLLVPVATDSKEDEKPVPVAKLKSIFAGDTCSACVFYEDRIEELYAWGVINGIDPPRRLGPELVKEFDHEELKDTMELTQTIHHLNFEDAVFGPSHYMVLLKCNNDRKAVLAWGETKYGKLGIGNIAKFNAKMKEKQKANRAVDADDEEDDANATVSFLAPALVTTLDDKDIVSLACDGEHSLAVSKTGTVFSWGYGVAGRLGLGDSEEAIRSHQEPTENPYFFRALDAMARESDDELENIMEESGDDEEDDDLDPAAAKAREAKRARQARAERMGGVDEELEQALLEDNEEDEVLILLQAKYMPKERFAIIEHTANLLNKKESEYRDIMHKYLKAMDDKERSTDIITLAIENRIEEAHVYNPHLEKLLIFHLEAQDQEEQKKAETKEDAVDDDDEDNDLATKQALLKEKIKEQEKKMAKMRPEELLKLEKSLKTRLDTPKNLTVLETEIARFFLAPCRFTHLYEKASVFLREKTLFDDSEMALKNDFITLLFSTYNIHFNGDRRLLKVFLLEMMKSHIKYAQTSDDILRENSLEWQVFVEVLRQGKLRKNVRELWVRPLKKIAADNRARDPCDALREFQKDQETAEGKVQEALGQLTIMSNDLFQDLTNTSVVAIMSQVEWLVEVLIDAFKARSRPVNQVIGRRLLRALAVIGIEDQEARLERLKRKNVGGNLVVLSQNAERFLLYLMMGLDDLQGHLAEEYGIAYETHPQLFPDQLLRFWENDRDTGKYADLEKEKGLSAYESYVAVNKAHEAKVDEQKKAVIPASQRLLLSDYLLHRSIHRRRIIQMPHECRKLLVLFDFLEEDESLTKGSVNIRLDPFNVDKAKETIKCGRCSHYHPPVTYPDDTDQDEKDPREAIQEIVIDESEVKNKVVLSAKTCSSLWRTLREPDFREIVATKAGEGAWKELMITLKKKRHKSFESRRHEKVEQYEEASRYLRRIKDAPQGTMVYLANADQPAVQEMADPARLFQRLEQIDTLSERTQHQSVQNVELFMDTVSLLKRECKKTTSEAKELQEAFNELTAQSVDQDLQQFKGDFKSVAGVSSSVKAPGKISVYKERGTIESFSYYYIKEVMGMLDDDPDKLNNPPPMCWGLVPITWFKFLRTSQTTVNQIEFFVDLDIFFITTEDDDIFDIKLVFDNQVLHHHQVSLALLQGDKGADIKKNAAKARGIPEDCYILRYQPAGDRVPASRPQTLWFRREELAEYLETLPRRFLRNSGGDHAQERTKSLIGMLRIDTDTIGAET